MNRLLMFAFILLALPLLSACSGENKRSVEAYCTTMAKHRDQYLTAMDTNADLAGLLGAAGAIGDLKIMWDAMAEVAPEDIRKDTEAVRDSWREAEDAAISGDYRKLFGNAIFNSGPIERVDAYIIANCDPYISSPHGIEVGWSHQERLQTTSNRDWNNGSKRTTKIERSPDRLFGDQGYS